MIIGRLSRRMPAAEAFLGVALAVAVAWLGLLPLLRLAAAAVWASGDVFASPSVVRALLRSVVTSLGGALVALALGGAYASVVALTDAGARRLLSIAALLPLLIPAQIIALAWMQMLSPGGPLPGWFGAGDDALYSGWGITLLLGVEHMPIVFLAARAAMAGIPGELIEAARAGGARRARVLRRIVLPLASPGLIAGFGLTVVACLGSFGVPAMIGISCPLSNLGRADLPAPDRLRPGDAAGRGRAGAGIGDPVGGCGTGNRMGRPSRRCRHDRRRGRWHVPDRARRLARAGHAGAVDGVGRGDGAAVGLPCRHIRIARVWRAAPACHRDVRSLRYGAAHGRDLACLHHLGVAGGRCCDGRRRRGDSGGAAAVMGGSRVVAPVDRIVGSNHRRARTRCRASCWRSV